MTWMGTLSTIDDVRSTLVKEHNALSWVLTDMDTL